MQPGAHRILTTHTESLPRTKDIVALLLAEQHEPGKHKAALATAVANAVKHVVARQIDCDIGTFASRVQVDTKIVWMKLQSLTEGVAMISKALWKKAA